MRNASLAELRLPASTTMRHSPPTACLMPNDALSCETLRLPPPMRGSSPSMGAVTLPSTSRRPLMVVLLTSSKYITAVGSASPATRPMSMMTEPLGLMGALLPVGDFIT